MNNKINFPKKLIAAKEYVKNKDKNALHYFDTGATLKELDISEKIFDSHRRPQFRMFLKYLSKKEHKLVYRIINASGFIISAYECQNPTIYANNKLVPGMTIDTKFISFSEAVSVYKKNRNFWRETYKRDLQKHTNIADDYYKKQRKIKIAPVEIVLSGNLYTEGKSPKEIEKEFQSYQNGSPITDLLNSLKDDIKYTPMNDLIKWSINIKNKWGFGGALTLCAYDLGRQAVICELESLGLDKEIINKLKIVYKPELLKRNISYGKEIYNSIQAYINKGRPEKSATSSAYYDFWENHSELDKKRESTKDRNQTLKNYVDLYKKYNID